MQIIQMILAFCIYLTEEITMEKVLTVVVLLAIGAIGGAVFSLWWLTREEGPREHENGADF